MRQLQTASQRDFTKTLLRVSCLIGARFYAAARTERNPDPYPGVRGAFAAGLVACSPAGEVRADDVRDRSAEEDQQEEHEPV